MLAQAYSIPVESPPHGRGMFACGLWAEKDILGKTLLPFLKHSILALTVVLGGGGGRKNVFFLITHQLNAEFCYLWKCVGHPAMARYQ